MFGFHEWRWHQKLTVTIDTPDGLKTGSAVTSARFSVSPEWWGLGDFAGSASSSLSGEAVTVDLGRGRYLFALLQDYGVETARKSFLPKEEQPGDRAQLIEVYDRLESIRGSRQLSRDLYPPLVTFDNINSPASVHLVNPDDLSVNFGPGYRISSITLSITDEPVTQGDVERALVWFYQVRRLIPTNQKPRLAKDRTVEQTVTKLDFISPDQWRDL
ncbi:hypothetical protein [Rhizobium paknamense]|uniref:Uncharacterized protein n=1 Tax=Rhizobium paknamense TaxID=1206817 RepID=A0ABU0IG29_9HYPH|nr:hypothetical protein [Rhizobium paknamense]MDQ0457167.1 hypothetical protein [Rhizobium paknamense]